MDWKKISRAFKWGSRFALLGAAVWGFGWFMTWQTPDQEKDVATKSGFASTGTEIWTTPGYKGPVDIWTQSIRSLGNYWEASPSFKLTLHGPAGSPDIIGTSNKTQDWGNSPYKTEVVLVMTLDIAVPADAKVGTDWHGDLKGQITNGTSFEGMTKPGVIEVNVPYITLHVTTTDEMNRHMTTPVDRNRNWKIIQWGGSILVWLIGVLAVARLWRGKDPIPVPARISEWWWRFRG